jgi:hypothetical protein
MSRFDRSLDDRDARWWGNIGYLRPMRSQVDLVYRDEQGVDHFYYAARRDDLQGEWRALLEEWEGSPAAQPQNRGWTEAAPSSLDRRPAARPSFRAGRYEGAKRYDAPAWSGDRHGNGTSNDPGDLYAIPRDERSS